MPRNQRDAYHGLSKGVLSALIRGRAAVNSTLKAMPSTANQPLSAEYSRGESAPVGGFADRTRMCPLSCSRDFHLCEFVSDFGFPPSRAFSPRSFAVVAARQICVIASCKPCPV